MGAACNPSIKAAVHGVEAHFITNKGEIQANHFISEDHVQIVLRQKRLSTCGLLFSMLHIPRRFLLCRTIQNKQCGMLSQGVVMICDNARSHAAATTQNLITTFGWEQLDHSPYSQDLVPSDFHLLLHLKSFLAGRQFHGNNKVKEAVTTCFASHVASFYDEGIQKLVQRYDKCLNSGGNNVNK